MPEFNSFSFVLFSYILYCYYNIRLLIAMEKLSFVFEVINIRFYEIKSELGISIMILKSTEHS